MKDLIGKAILDFQTNNFPENVMTATNISDIDELEIAYLFRDFDEMPVLERRALAMSSGRILDVGCGAGSHSLYLQNKKLDVTAIDISPNAVKACLLRGLTNVVVADIMTFEGSFDTILLMMNGTGICGSIEKIVPFFEKLKSLLNEGGQILVDSSDIIYMFDEDEIQQKRQDFEYYGQLTFDVSYKGEKEDAFDWLYLDFDTMTSQAEVAGLRSELILKGDSHDYLARLF